MKKETIVILILAVLLVASAAALVIQRQRYNVLLAAYQEAEAKNKSQGNTIGGTVKPGEPILDITPLDDTLLVEARVKPQDVAFLRPGQDVMVKITAYDFSIYGGLDGKLEQISADTIEDKRGEFYYLVKVRTKKTALVYHNEVLPIIPGMMVQADILIGKKTVLQYLLKPILKAKQNALTER